MLNVVKENVTVKKGGKIEIKSSILPPGAKAEVLIIYESNPKNERSLMSFFGKGKGCFKSVEEVDDYIRKERDSWE